jgi:prepilin-type N-terminal cleavage/methylation domain-containing protein
MGRRGRGRKGGFTLVETVIALAVLSTLLISVFCLLGVAVRNTESEASLTGAGCLLSGLISDIRASSPTAAVSPFYGINLPTAGSNSTTPTTLYLDINYNKVSTAAEARYQVNYWTSGSSLSFHESTVRLLITWPAGAAYTNAQGSVETVLAVNRNI